jgi:hypothetical protein
MSDPGDGGPGRPGARPPAGRLWFLAERDAFLRRFILRTVLEPPRFVRRPRPRWLGR